MGGFLNPIVNVMSVEYKGMGLNGVTIEAKLRVENPNLGTLDGTNIAFKIRKKSDGTVLAEGDVPRDFKVSPVVRGVGCQSTYSDKGTTNNIRPPFQLLFLAKIPPREATDVSLPVTFGYGGMGAAGASVIRRGQTDLVIEGDLTFEAPFANKGVTDVPFKGEATLALENDPPS